MDVLTKRQRSYCMSQIRNKNTTAEVIFRKQLWYKGWRYRIHSNLPGRPDIVFQRLKVVIFIDGCFWHKCPLHFQLPKKNRKFWNQKISGNVARDKTNNQKLLSRGWKVLRFWEHEIKNQLHIVEKRTHKILKNRER